MLIVDAQIHLWNAGNPTSPWHRQVPAYLKDMKASAGYDDLAGWDARIQRAFPAQVSGGSAAGPSS